MQSSRENPFNMRAFVALGAAFSGLMLPFTGYANHVYQFDPFIVQRHAWMSAHNVSAVLFLVFVSWHVLLNRRMLIRHARGSLMKMTFPSREAILGLLVVASMTLLIVGHAFVVR
jgi:hypothetical protein